jgi:hypothetical protein
MVYKSSSQKIKLRRLKLIGILEQMREPQERHNPSIVCSYKFIVLREK